MNIYTKDWLKQIKQAIETPGFNYKPSKNLLDDESPFDLTIAQKKIRQTFIIYLQLKGLLSC